MPEAQAGKLTTGQVRQVGFGDGVLKECQWKGSPSSHLVDVKVVNYGIETRIQIVKKCHHLTGMGKKRP